MSLFKRLGRVFKSYTHSLQDVLTETEEEKQQKKMVDDADKELAKTMQEKKKQIAKDQEVKAHTGAEEVIDIEATEEGADVQPAEDDPDKTLG